MVSRNNGKLQSRQYPEDRSKTGVLDCRNLSLGQRDQATNCATLVDCASRAWRMMPISLTVMRPFLSCPAAANSEGEAGPVNCHAPSYRLFDLRF
jgi:hypothetical protein